MASRTSSMNSARKVQKVTKMVTFRLSITRTMLCFQEGSSLRPLPISNTDPEPAKIVPASGGPNLSQPRPLHLKYGVFIFTPRDHYSTFPPYYHHHHHAVRRAIIICTSKRSRGRVVVVVGQGGGGGGIRIAIFSSADCVLNGTGCYARWNRGRPGTSGRCHRRGRGGGDGGLPPKELA